MMTKQLLRTRDRYVDFIPIATRRMRNDLHKLRTIVA